MPCQRYLEITADNHDTIYLKTCAQQALTLETLFWLKLYRQYQNGFLPFSGGYLEQPAPFIQAIEEITRHHAG